MAFFDPEEVKRIINANLSGREDYNLQVFQLLNLELWQRQFLDSLGAWRRDCCHHLTQSSSFATRDSR